MIERNLAKPLQDLARLYPVVTVTGPRQSGKTTLCRAVFSDRPYVSLEPLDTREFAQTDPRGFLNSYPQGVVIDEVQQVPGLLSYLQTEVDARPEPGRFILTGSQHFGLSQGIAQSLAGRTGVLHLLPLSLDELRRFPSPPKDLFTTLFMGGYPRIHDLGIPAERWLADYITTYVQRDVRQVLNVVDLQTFTMFLKLCAGRSSQEVGFLALGNDAGVTHNTARAWLSVLETSFLLFRLPAWHRNFKKQLIKTPKLHFFDSGLLCHLLGIREPGQIVQHPLRGAIFETWAVGEIYKVRAHRGLQPDLYHYRESRGTEVDLVLERARSLVLVEMKSGATVAADFFTSLGRLHALVAGSGERRQIEERLVYGGDQRQQRTEAQVIPWDRVAFEDWV